MKTSKSISPEWDIASCVSPSYISPQYQPKYIKIAFDTIRFTDTHIDGRMAQDMLEILACLTWSKGGCPLTIFSWGGVRKMQGGGPLSPSSMISVCDSIRRDNCHWFKGRTIRCMAGAWMVTDCARHCTGQGGFAVDGTVCYNFFLFVFFVF